MSGARFQRLRTADTVLLVAEEHWSEVACLGLTEPGGLERWCADGTPVPGGRARGWRLALGADTVVHLREMAHGGALRRLTGRRFLRLDRAIAGLEGAAELRARGVAVPAPVLLHARRRGPFWHVVLAHAFVASSESGARLLADSADPARLARAARVAGARIRAFHDAGGSHPDLHVGNLLLDADGEVTVVDLEGVGVGVPPSPARRRRELARLRRSLAKQGTAPPLQRRLVAAFLRGYLGRDRVLRNAVLGQPTG